MLVVLAFVVLAFALPDPFKGGDKVGVALIGVPIAAVLLMLARPSVTAGPDGLVVRNLVGTRRLQWAEVVAIRLGRDDSWASIDVADGSTLAVMALQTMDGQHTTAALAELRAMIAEADERR